jgi:ketosteroid isomerase-like protein
MKAISYLIFVLFFFFQPTLSPAQKPNSLQYPTLLKELNRDVWMPYSAAIRANDLTKLTAVLSQDFIRVHPFQKQILNRTQFSEEINKAFLVDQKDEGKPKPYDIQFRFLERVITEDFASERGVFQYIFITQRGEKTWIFEKFHVLSRKEQGGWKMLAFYSSHEKQSVTPQTFAEALPIDHISKY